MMSSLPQCISSAMAVVKSVGVGGSPFRKLVGIGRDTGGQDLAEYGLLASLIAIVAIAALTLLGLAVSGMFNSMAGAF